MVMLTFLPLRHASYYLPTRRIRAYTAAETTQSYPPLYRIDGARVRPVPPGLRVYQEARGPL